MYTHFVHVPLQHQNPYDMFVSPSSGPPSIHPIGSGELTLLSNMYLLYTHTHTHTHTRSVFLLYLASSLARQQSPHSDVTDHVSQTDSVYTIYFVSFACTLCMCIYTYTMYTCTVSLHTMYMYIHECFMKVLTLVGICSCGFSSSSYISALFFS